MNYKNKVEGVYEQLQDYVERKQELLGLKKKKLYDCLIEIHKDSKLAEIGLDEVIFASSCAREGLDGRLHAKGVKNDEGYSVNYFLNRGEGYDEQDLQYDLADGKFQNYLGELAEDFPILEVKDIDERIGEYLSNKNESLIEQTDIMNLLFSEIDDSSEGE